MNEWVKRHWVDIVMVAVVTLLTGYIHVWLGVSRNLLPAGDTFNFINGANTLRAAKWPVDEKRLPLYSVLILIAQTVVDDPVDAAISVAVLFGILAIAAAYILGRKLSVHWAILGTCMLLAAVDPVLTLWGIRPLSQSIFLFTLPLAILATIHAKPTSSSIWLSAFALGACALTRVEGIIGAAVLFVLHAQYISHKYLAKLLVSLVIITLPWILIIWHSTGAPWRFPTISGYGTEAASGARGAPDLFTLIAGIPTVVEGSWSLPWTLPTLYEEEDERNPGESQLMALISDPRWWISLAAITGAVAFSIQKPRLAVTVFLPFIAVLLVGVWYRPTLKYVNPIVLVWYIAIAYGISFWYMQVKQRFTRPIVTTSLGCIFLFWVLSTQLTPELQASYKVVTTDNGEAVSELAAYRYVASLNQKVLVDAFTPIALGYLHFSQNAIYLEDYLGTGSLESVQFRSIPKFDLIIHNGTESMQQVIDRLGDVAQPQEAFVTYIPHRGEYEKVQVYKVHP